jgi:hypothetical protein
MIVMMLSAHRGWVKSVTIKPDGTNVFLNKLNLPVAIHTQYPAGMNWICHTESNGNFVLATVESVEVVEFLSVTDTVKTIHFQYYTSSYQVINAGVHNKRIKLSKNFGMIQALPFYVFPNIIYSNDNYDSEPVIEYELTGIDSEIGDSNIGYKDFFDFQPGDELHTYSENKYGYEDHNIRREITKIIDRTDYGEDSVMYVISRCGVYYNYSSSQPLIQTYHDTITRVYRFNNPTVILSYQWLPQETYFPNSSNAAYLWMRKSYNNRLYKQFMSGIEMPVFYNDCYQLPIFDGCYTRSSYVHGLGGPYYACSFFNVTIIKRELVSFQKR